MKPTTKIIIMIVITIVVISCSSEKPYTERIENGLRMIENSKLGINPDLKIILTPMYTIENSETDTSFVLNFPGDRTDLNSDLDDDGNLYAVDNKRSLILKFSNTGKFIRDWGGKGQGPGEFPRGPVDISISDKDSTVYVFDGSGRLTLFDLDGGFRIFHNVIGRSARAKNFYLTGSGPVFGCETYEGQWGSDDFKMGTCLFSSTKDFTIGEKLFGELKKFDIKQVDADDQGLLAAVRDEYIYEAGSSKNDYRIYRYTADGKKDLEIKKKYAPVRRSEEDIAGIRSALDKFTKSSNGMVQFKPVSNLKSVISQMFIDQHGNLWTSVNESLFNDDAQEFDIFDKNGIFLKRVLVPELAGLKVRSKGEYLIASTPIEENYSEDGKADIVIKVFKLKIEG